MHPPSAAPANRQPPPPPTAAGFAKRERERERERGVERELRGGDVEVNPENLLDLLVRDESDGDGGGNLDAGFILLHSFIPQSNNRRRRRRRL